MTTSVPLVSPADALGIKPLSAKSAAVAVVRNPLMDSIFVPFTSPPFVRFNSRPSHCVPPITLEPVSFPFGLLCADHPPLRRRAGRQPDGGGPGRGYCSRDGPSTGPMTVRNTDVRLLGSSRER